MTFYSDLAGCTVTFTSNGKTYITPLEQKDFDNEIRWTASPLYAVIQLLLKITSHRSIADLPEVEHSDEDETTEPTTRILLDGRPESAVSSQPLHQSLTGNLTIARVDGGPP